MATVRSINDIEADMTTKTGFNLYSLIAERLKSSRDPNPRNVAQEVADAIPDEHLREALTVLLPGAVTNIAGNMRRNGSHSMDHTSRLRAVTSRRRGRQAAVAVYAGILAERILVAGEWKFLGECSKSDLMAASAARQMVSDNNAAWAKKYARLAKMLGSEQTVSDLPLSMVVEALS